MSGEEFKRFEAAGWDAAAATYGSLTGRATALAFEPLLDLARVGAGARVLDLGCGPGGLATAAAARGADPTGVDLSEKMISAARTAHPTLRFQVEDAEALPFREEFDAVAGAFVLNHVPDPPRAVSGVRDALVPGGRAAFAVWDRPEHARLTSLLADAVERAGFDRAAGIPDGPDDTRYSDPDELRRLLESCGFEGVETDRLETTVEVESLDALWDGLLGGTARSAAAVRRAGAAAEARVRSALDDVAGEFLGPDGGLEVPTVIIFGAGRRPGALSVR